MDGQVIWITGLSGAGKTTVAEALGQSLGERNLTPILLDGDVLRDLFRSSDEISGTYIRDERIILAYKYALLCKKLSSQGFTVIASTISMYDEIYAWNRTNLPNYFEIYLKVPLKELRRRDPKKIYQRYDASDLSDVAGLDIAVDEPFEPYVILDFETHPFLYDNPTNIAEYLISKLEKE